MDFNGLTILLKENPQTAGLIALGVILLIFAIVMVSRNKTEAFAPFKATETAKPTAEQKLQELPQEAPQVVEPVETKELAPVKPEITNNSKEITPEDLLPKSDAKGFNEQFPKGQGEVSDKNFLIAGYNIGINTVASSLKNANLQLRSDPYIKREDVGPWGQSTIMASDITNRKTLDIGS